MLFQSKLMEVLMKVLTSFYDNRETLFGIFFNQDMHKELFLADHDVLDSLNEEKVQIKLTEVYKKLVYQASLLDYLI